MSFRGLPDDLLAFLRDLEQHNDRDWFQANRDRYEKSWLQPALALCEALQEPLHAISPHVLVVPKKVGGSLLRIHRDVRFSKDKRPFTTSITLRFGHDRDKAGPGYYLRIDPQQLHIGAGVWRPEPAALARIRDHIVANEDRWRAVRDDPAFVRAYDGLGGESLKRPPKGFDPDHPLIEDLKRKDIVAFGTRPAEEATRPDLIARLEADYRAASPFVAFTCEALGLPW